MRAICEALGFDPTNHHNAAKCPYCRTAEPSQDAESIHIIAMGIVDAAREALDGGDDRIDTINIPSHLAAVLSLRLDDLDAARAAQAQGEKGKV